MVENPVRRIFLLKFDDRRSGVAGWFFKEDDGGGSTAPTGPEFCPVMLNTVPVCNSTSLCAGVCLSFDTDSEISLTFSASQMFLEVEVVFLFADFSVKPTYVVIFAFQLSDYFRIWIHFTLFNSIRFEVEKA